MKLEEKSETRSWGTLCASTELKFYFEYNGEALNAFEQKKSAIIKF